VVLAITTLMSFEKPPVTSPLSNKQTLSEQPTTGEKITFTPVIEGRGIKKGAEEVSFARYKSGDGVLVERRIERYRSAPRARAEMQTMVEKAATVIERGAKLPGEGQQKGQRVVLSVPHGRGRERQAVILWSDGPDLYVLRSPSLRHVLAFEKQAYEAPPPSHPPKPKRPPLPLPP